MVLLSVVWRWRCMWWQEFAESRADWLKGEFISWVLLAIKNASFFRKLEIWLYILVRVKTSLGKVFKPVHCCSFSAASLWSCQHSLATICLSDTSEPIRISRGPSHKAWRRRGAGVTYWEHAVELLRARSKVKTGGEMWGKLQVNDRLWQKG